MFKKLFEGFVNRKVDNELNHGLSIVQNSWQAYKSSKPAPSDDDIVQFVAPFISTAMAQLNSDVQWSKKPQATKIELIFTVFLAEDNTELSRQKLLAMLSHLMKPPA